jgi:hypothetical protein
LLFSPGTPGLQEETKETQMDIKRLILTGCSVVVLSAGPHWLAHVTPPAAPQT